MALPGPSILTSWHAARTSHFRKIHLWKLPSEAMKPRPGREKSRSKHGKSHPKGTSYRTPNLTDWEGPGGLQWRPARNIEELDGFFEWIRGQTDKTGCAIVQKCRHNGDRHNRSRGRYEKPNPRCRAHPRSDTDWNCGRADDKHTIFEDDSGTGWSPRSTDCTRTRLLER